MVDQEPSPDVVIRSKRAKLARQAVTVTAAGIAVGTVLQSMGVLSTSRLGTLGAAMGLPLVAIVVSAVALALSIVIVWDSWHASITLGPAGLRVKDGLGEYDLPYANIREYKTVPLGGVVIAIRDLDAWLEYAGGDTDIRRRIAAVIDARYGGHVWFYDKHLAIGGPAFVELLGRRIREDAERSAAERDA